MDFSLFACDKLERRRRAGGDDVRFQLLKAGHVLGLDLSAHVAPPPQLHRCSGTVESKFAIVLQMRQSGCSQSDGRAAKRPAARSSEWSSLLANEYVLFPASFFLRPASCLLLSDSSFLLPFSCVLLPACY